MATGQAQWLVLLGKGPHEPSPNNSISLAQCLSFLCGFFLPRPWPKNKSTTSNQEKTTSNQRLLISALIDSPSIYLTVERLRHGWRNTKARAARYTNSCSFVSGNIVEVGRSRFRLPRQLCFSFCYFWQVKSPFSYTLRRPTKHAVFNLHLPIYLLSLYWNLGQEFLL